MRAHLVGLTLAHQGGWDEILFAVVPIAVIAVLLRVANSRAKKLSPPAPASPAPPSAKESD